MTNNKIRDLIAPLFLLTLFLVAIPVTQLVPDVQLGLSSMPGDLGDARLVNYFLENVYQFLLGRSDSLWHLGFYWPFPYMLGFSDNLFGSSPVYIIARRLIGQPDTAFQIWFLVGYIANFWAAYYVLTKLGISRLSACVGATIFAFAIPVTAHAGHAQLHYRFGVPLSLLFLVNFLERKNLRLLTCSFGWLVWQFYCGVYIGFFALLLLAATTAVFVFQNRANIRVFLSEFIAGLRQDWNRLPRWSKAILIAAWVVLLGLLAVLFYPYLQVSHLYDANRTWGEISSMLPRPQSYLLADTSWLWSQPDAKLFASIPMRHEHQMFPGVVSMALLLMAIVHGIRSEDASGRAFSLMVGALGLLFILTINIGGVSFWFLFHWMPLASAIRAMTRIDLVMLLPLVIAAGYFLDQMRNKWLWGTRLILILILPALLIELSATSMYTSSKADWRQRLESKRELAPQATSGDAILFFPGPESDDGQFHPDLDVMWVSLELGRKTMNGYSGGHPPGTGYGFQYGADCSVLPQRILSFQDFAENRLDEKPNYQQLMAKVVPVGLVGCDPGWWISPPKISTASRAYSKEEFSKLSFTNAGVAVIDGYSVLKFDILNNNEESVSARSGVGRPVRISWRYLDVACTPRSGWDLRKDIPFDIPAKGALPMVVSLGQASLRESCGVEVSIVQELEFWGHDVGITPLQVRF